MCQGAGDASTSEFLEPEFDVVFSKSVTKMSYVGESGPWRMNPRVGGLLRQKPNRYVPIEPPSWFRAFVPALSVRRVAARRTWLVSEAPTTRRASEVSGLTADSAEVHGLFPEQALHGGFLGSQVICRSQAGIDEAPQYSLDVLESAPYVTECRRRWGRRTQRGHRENGNESTCADSFGLASLAATVRCGGLPPGVSERRH